MSIIGLCGFKGAGKTVISNHLVHKHGFKEITFAGPLKDIVSILYGFDREMLEGDTITARELRESIRDPIWNRTPREALQFVGTDIMRNYHDPNTWVSLAMRRIHELTTNGQNVVISDLRFPNEYEALKTLGAKIWRINRHDFTEKEISEMHSSENSFLHFKHYDSILNNYTSIKDLLILVDDLLKPSSD